MALKEDAVPDAPVSNFFQSFEAENRRKRKIIIGLAVIAFVASMAALVGTMQSVGTMNAHVINVFEEEKADEAAAPDMAKMEAVTQEAKEVETEAMPEESVEVPNPPVQSAEP